MVCSCGQSRRDGDEFTCGSTGYRAEPGKVLYCMFCGDRFDTSGRVKRAAYFVPGIPPRTVHEGVKHHA